MLEVADALKSLSEHIKIKTAISYIDSSKSLLFKLPTEDQVNIYLGKLDVSDSVKSEAIDEFIRLIDNQVHALEAETFNKNIEEYK